MWGEKEGNLIPSLEYSFHALDLIPISDEKSLTPKNISMKFHKYTSCNLCAPE